MQPVHIEDTTDYLCKCGHRKGQHWLVFGGEMPCVANRLNELDEDEDPCRCFNFSSKETK